MNNWLCDLGHQLSHYAFGELTRAHGSRGRLQSSETGITHVLTRVLWEVALQHGRTHRIAVAEVGSSEERRTGADLELWFTDGAVGVGWRIQAKRLYASGGSMPPRFERLDHKVGRRMQATVLTDSTDSDSGRGVPVVPLYWLYTFDPSSTTCSGDPRCCCGAQSSCDGILAVGGHEMRTAVLRRKQLVEPFSHHRWANEGTALTSILCEAARRSDPRDVLDVIAAYSTISGENLVPSDALPEYVYELLEGGQEVDRQAEVAGRLLGSPEARVTAVIDVRE